ncbi:MAG: PilZ domain-containing protein [Novosphingobium sp.]|nr:PilZ domain-containing protein [Novosphingobium sp.]
MSALRIIDNVDEAAEANECRVAKRSRVFMRANMRVRGSTFEYPLSIKDISSTGLKAAMDVSLFPGTRVEIDLRNIGWVAGEVVWVDSKGVVGVRFSAVVQPERTHSQVSGSYGPAPSSVAPQLRRL